MINKEEKLLEEILAYFRGHPDAGDTLEGIAACWLVGGKPGWTVKQVAAVLDILLQEGIIRVITTQSGNVIYKLTSTRV